MLTWLRSAPYPALCPCEPLRPVVEMQAVSYGARSRQYSPLLPASSSQPRSIVERPRSGPMGRVHIYTTIEVSQKRPRHVYKHTLPRLARSTLNAAAPGPKNKNEHVRSDPPTHHGIVKQYRKGLTAVVDRCVVYTYPTIGTTLFRKVVFVAVLVETRAC